MKDLKKERMRKKKLIASPTELVTSYPYYALLTGIGLSGCDMIECGGDELMLG